MSEKKSKINRLTSTAVIALVVFSLFAPMAADAFCVFEDDGVTCGSDCTEGEECGPADGVPTGACANTVDAATETSGMFCYNETELANARIEEDSAAAATDDAIADRRSPKPILAINIPTVQFSSVRKSLSTDGQYYIIQIPWLADYIIGIYRYSVFIGTILSVVMIMIGGIGWLTAGGDAGRVTNAKNRINNAVVGLLLIMGSFLILSNINPNLTVLNPLTVKAVNPDRYSPKQVLQTTTEDTGNPLEMP